MTKLVIVESPGKTKKIKSYLGSDYNVVASVGHIRDLAKNNDSIDVNNNFEPTYEITKDKTSVVRNLRSAAKSASEIIIASDGDREGEAIAFHLITVLGCQSNYKRIVFHEITKNAITKALNQPTLVDMNMFYSQQARRILDRIVGYKLSPILKKIDGIQSNSLGAGRVQSVVTRLIVDKENEINAFMSGDKSSVYNINGEFVINKSKFKAHYVNYEIIPETIDIQPIITNTNMELINGQTIESYKISKSAVDSKDQIKIIVLNIKSDPIFKILNVSDTERQRHPPQPFITSSLQQEASYKLKFKLKDTMQYAQRLYEKGLITYMRTDSPTLSTESLGMIKKHILADPGLGETYYQFRQFKAKGQNAQEAHEAIRPTHFNVFEIEGMEGSNEEKLYQLIWNRTVASQMASAKYQDQHITLSNTKNVVFEGTNSVLVFDGFLKLYSDTNTDADQNNESDENSESAHIKIDTNDLSNNNVNWSKITFKETFSNPPTRYNEPSLVKKLEGLGIGRPSTYATMISKIQEHKYIRIGNVQGIEKKINTYVLTNIAKSDKTTSAKTTTDKTITFDKKSSIQKIGSEKLKLLPTDDGILVTNYLIKHFPQIMDYKFTAQMETLLDDIAEGKKIWHNVLSEYYEILKQQFLSLGLQIDAKYMKPIKNTNNTNLHIESTNDLSNTNDWSDNDDSDTVKNKNTNTNNLPVKEFNQNHQVIGSHPKYGEITYMVAKYGPCFKINLGGKSKKDFFVSAGKLKPTDTNILTDAIKFIDYKLNKSATNSTNKDNKYTANTINKATNIKKNNIIKSTTKFVDV